MAPKRLKILHAALLGTGIGAAFKAILIVFDWQFNQPAAELTREVIECALVSGVFTVLFAPIINWRIRARYREELNLHGGNTQSPDVGGSEDSVTLAGSVLWRGKPVTGFASRRHLIRVIGGSLIFFVVAYTFIKGCYVDIYALIFNDMPSTGQSADSSFAIAVSLAFAFVLAHLGRRRELRRSGHLEYALSQHSLTIVSRRGKVVFGQNRFHQLSIRTRGQGSPSDLIIKMTAAGETKPTRVTLYAIQDPIPVAGLIRATLAPHTLTLAKNIQGNLA